jgi:hypothetical protein
MSHANCWTIWSGLFGPLEGYAVVVQDEDEENDEAQARTLAAAIGQPVTEINWDEATTEDGSGWTAGDGLDTEDEARAAAVEQGFKLIPKTADVVEHLRALADAANRRTPPWIGDVEASAPEIHAEVMRRGLWFTLSHTQGNLTGAGVDLLRANHVTDQPTPGTRKVKTLVCPECGSEVQARYSTWFYERDGGMQAVEDGDPGSVQEYWCSECSESLDEADFGEIELPVDPPPKLSRAEAFRAWCEAVDNEPLAPHEAAQLDAIIARLEKPRALVVQPDANIEISHPFEHFRTVVPDRRLDELIDYSGVLEDGDDAVVEASIIKSILAELKMTRTWSIPVLTVKGGKLDAEAVARIQTFMDEARRGASRSGDVVLDTVVGVSYDSAQQRAVLADHQSWRAPCEKCGALPTEGCKTPGREGCPFNRQPGQCSWCDAPATERSGLCKSCDDKIPF